MARKLKPVDDTPICDPAYVRRINAVWTRGGVPPGFWQDRAHRRDYLLWLAHQLGFRTMRDWYRLTRRSMARNRGGGVIVLHWKMSPLCAVRDVFPEYDWQPWLFAQVPLGFWDSRRNRRKYVAWLGERLGCRRAEDWYAATARDFSRNRGGPLLRLYGGSPSRAVIDLVPGRNWCEWKFAAAPKGFWDVPENRRRYLRWLGRELGFRKPRDWYRIRHQDISARRGGALLLRYSSYLDLMCEFLPQLDWDRLDGHRPIALADILVWADAYHSRHGKWPTQKSGEIPESGDTWCAIRNCLSEGFRGLPRGSSLAKILQKYRGVPIGQTWPRLSEEQILAWADSHFAACGQWPTSRSGPIAGTTEKWVNLDMAMRYGLRGFSPRRSLAQLLIERRGMRSRGNPPP